MANQQPVRAVVNSAGTIPNNQGSLSLVLVNPDGSSAGTVKPQTKPADSVASTVAGVVTDFNALLAKLVTAGVLK